MSLRALLYAYVLGGITFIPLLILTCISITVYTSVPAPVPNTTKSPKPRLSSDDHPKGLSEPTSSESSTNDLPRTRKAWLTVRRTFEDVSDSSYVTFVKSYLDARSKDPKRSRPKDMWYVVLKGKVMYLYEDEAMTECEAAVELGSHDVAIYPEGLLDGELFTRRNAICLKPRSRTDKSLPSPSKETAAGDAEHVGEVDKEKEAAQEDTLAAPWFIFVRCCVDMEDWYLALVHASDHPPGTPMLGPLKPVFLPLEMNDLVATLDEQPDVIPMRWFNALLGRVFYSFYRTQTLESYIIGRLMKKLSKVKRPAFLTDVAVTQFSVGNKAPTFSKPMLKELTKEGDASLEVGLSYKGEIRATVEATAVIHLGTFKSYTVKLVLAVVLRELEGNLLVKVKRPPSSRIWYAFTKPPRMVVNVEPIVSDRQITWSMILNTIEAKIEEIITDSVVLPHMDDISFFDSAKYEHRGGLWADAVRSDKPATAPAPEATTKHTIHVVDSQRSEEAGPSTPVRTHFEELVAEMPSSDSVPVNRPVSTSTERSSTTARRRSWFSSSMETELHHEEVKEVEEVVSQSRTEQSAELSTPPTDAPVMQPCEDNDQNAHEYLVPRPSSAHSHTRSRSSRACSTSSSVGGDEALNYLSDSSATSNKRQTLGTSTASSFLSTLKSKAGDKQALSNTAKEAIRKWGVWGLKKDITSPDDVGDVGSSDRSSRIESAHGRQNYADMRAAFIERREREQSERINGGASPIPIQGREKGRSPSLSGSRMTSYSNGSTSTGLSRSLGDNVSNDGFQERDFGEVEQENGMPSLIHTQPSQARTMTIPGIHASHRGEVMSMGNVAAAPTGTEGKGKNATMQSMYRLWKSPILTGQQSGEGQGTSAGRGDTDDRNHDVAPLSLTAEANGGAAARPVPPPLPPRTVSTVVARHTGETADESQVGKSVMSRDETRSLAGEMDNPDNGWKGASAVGSTAVTSIAPDGKPRLPPRRVPVQ